MLCCGKERETNFCPDCGAHLGASAGQSLLAHVRAHARQLDERAREWSEAGEDVPLSRCEKAASKWKAWQNWLEMKVADESAKVAQRPATDAAT